MQKVNESLKSRIEELMAEIEQRNIQINDMNIELQRVLSAERAVSVELERSRAECDTNKGNKSCLKNIRH
jgi:hypothetical protein